MQISHNSRYTNLSSTTEDHSYGVNVEEIEVEPTRGFQVRRFAEVADEVFENGIDAYNRLHGSD